MDQRLAVFGQDSDGKRGDQPKRFSAQPGLFARHFFHLECQRYVCELDQDILCTTVESSEGITRAHHQARRE